MRQYPRSLACTDCKQAGSRQTLATLGVRDWQGTLVCICRDCYNKNPRPLPKFEVSCASSGDGTSLCRQRLAMPGQAFLDLDSFHKSRWRSRKTSAKCRVESFQRAQQKLEKCLGLKRLLGEVTNTSGIVQFFPCIWPNSATTALHSRMKEIIARVHTEVNEGMFPDEMIQKCVDIAVKSVHEA